MREMMAKTYLSARAYFTRTSPNPMTFAEMRIEHRRIIAQERKRMRVWSATAAVMAATLMIFLMGLSIHERSHMNKIQQEAVALIFE